jgi:hypothetical protein
MIVWNAFLHFDLVSQRTTFIRAEHEEEQANKDYSFSESSLEGSGATAKRFKIVFAKEQDVLNMRRAFARESSPCVWNGGVVRGLAVSH